MTDFYLIGCTILACWATYIIGSQMLSKLENIWHRHEQRKHLKDVIIISRELRSWYALLQPQSSRSNSSSSGPFQFECSQELNGLHDLLFNLTPTSPETSKVQSNEPKSVLKSEPKLEVPIPVTSSIGNLPQPKSRTLTQSLDSV